MNDLSPEPTMITGIPPAEVVKAHATAYPVSDPHGTYGGLWIVQDPDARVGPNFPTFLRLETHPMDYRIVMMWNGVSFTQPLDECAWAARSRYRPVDPHGMPVTITASIADPTGTPVTIAAGVHLPGRRMW